MGVGSDQVSDPAPCFFGPARGGCRNHVDVIKESPLRSRGFTLVELIAVMIVPGKQTRVLSEK
jgi:hypothetical protein